MALRIRYASTPGATLGYSIERLADGLYFDFANAAFTATPTTQVNSLTATTGNLIGLYRDTIASTPQAVFLNGEYAVNIHNIGASNAVIGVLGATMYGGDSAPVFPAAAVDPWSASLPGSYLTGTAGSIIGTYLDAKVSSRSTGVGSGTDPWATSLPGSYALGTAGAILGSYLDAKVSTRSIYAGGPVASVSAPVTVGTVNDKAGYSLAANQAYSTTGSVGGVSSAVTVGTVSDKTGYTLAPTQVFSTTGSVGGVSSAVTVGTVNDKAGYSLAANQAFSTTGSVGGVSSAVTVGTVSDKTGYSLAPSGLDGILVETGINVRQALSPILASSAGSLSGAGTGTIIIRGGNVATTRITATTDNAGNRSTVTLSLPT